MYGSAFSRKLSGGFDNMLKEKMNDERIVRVMIIGGE
jgi:hypothetical protein